MQTEFDFHIRRNIKASDIAWFKTGGTIRRLIEPRDIDELSMFLKYDGADYLLLGAGSNTLISDRPIDTVLRLNHFQKIELINENLLHVDAGVLTSMLNRICMAKQVGGLEFTSTIPGTIGGLVFMNAGAYGLEMKDVIEYVDMLDEKGEKYRLQANDIRYEYRSSNIPKNHIICSCALKVYKETIPNIVKKTQEMQQHRKESQPLNNRSLGSTFKNPQNMKAWELIDSAGLRGVQKGSMIISQKHPNFIENLGGGKAEDAFELMKLMREEVMKKHHINLELENILIGFEESF